MNRYDPIRHEYWKGDQRIPGVSEILAMTGHVDKRFFTPEKAEFGRKVHEICNLLDAGLITIDDVEAAFRGYAEAWELFKSETGITFIESEQWRISDKYLFGGTPDRVGIFRGRRCIPDIKAGVKAKWHGLQLNAYRILVDKQIDLLFDVHLNAMGHYYLQPYPVSDEFLGLVGKYYKGAA